MTRDDCPPISANVQSDSEIGSSRRSGSDCSLSRGYTSDSELYNAEHQSTLSNRQKQSAASTNAGGWILVRYRGVFFSLLRNEVDFDGFSVTQVGKEGEIETIRMKNVQLNQYAITMNCELMPHDTRAFMKSCESLAFLVRDVAHITPENFEICVRCIQTFVDASMNGGEAHWQLWICS